MSNSRTAEYTSGSHDPHWSGRLAFTVIEIAFLMTEIALGVALYHGLDWLAVPLILLAAHFMHGMLIGFHEASHGLLRSNRALNDSTGAIIGILSFFSFTLYRATHQTHHAYLSTERDEELWPFVHPEKPRWFRVSAALLELTFGLFFTPFLFFRAFLRPGSPIRSKKVRQRIWFELLLMGLVWTVILCSAVHWHVLKYLLWMYLAPAFLAGNMQSWRKYIEHVGLTGGTENSATRNVVSETWFGRFMSFTLLHEPYHGVHHLHAGLPHAELPQYVSELQPTDPGDLLPYLSYRHALKDLLLSLSNPRVGAQWHTSEGQSRVG